MVVENNAMKRSRRVLTSFTSTSTTATRLSPTLRPYQNPRETNLMNDYHSLVRIREKDHCDRYDDLYRWVHLVNWWLSAVLIMMQNGSTCALRKLPAILRLPYIPSTQKAGSNRQHLPEFVEACGKRFRHPYPLASDVLQGSPRPVTSSRLL